MLVPVEMIVSQITLVAYAPRMITDPDAVTVLCYGDSNTNGQPAEEVNEGRWPANVRWPGQLQILLGDGYSVIEEGLGGRTTDIDDASAPSSNGRRYLFPCLHSHSPLDVVVLMLGTNDLKNRFDRSAAQITDALSGLVDDIEQSVTNRDGTPPKIILMSPAHLDHHAAAFNAHEELGAIATEKSQQLSASLRTLAAARGVLFADAATVARVGDDGVHLTRDSHRGIAELVAKTITEAVAAPSRQFEPSNAR